MRGRIWTWGVTLGLVASLLAGCGGSSSSTIKTPATGGLVTLVADAPFCDVLSFRTTLTQYVLIPKGSGTGGFPLGTAPFVPLDLGALRDFPNILVVAPITEGTYDQVQVRLGTTLLTLYDPTQDPPIQNVTATLSNTTIKIPINPPLVVTGRQVSAVQLDFDIRRSVTLDVQGQVTSNVNPVLRAEAIASTTADGFGRLEDVVGFVRTVTPTTTVAGFTGSFGLQTLGSQGPFTSVFVTTDTQFFGLDTLNRLATGTFAEVNGFVDTKGNFVARSVEFEDREDATKNQAGFVGIVTSLTRDSSGNATEFQLFAREEDPEVRAVVPLDSLVDVTVSSSTVYQFSSRFANFASLPFDATGLAVGQEVIAHGIATPPPATTGTTPTAPPTVAADAVYLKLQAQAGNFSSLVTAGSDDRTGAFFLAPCATLFQGAPILVITNSQTTFINLGGLSGLTPQPSLLVKGLLFFEQQAQTISGVSVPAGTLVLLATQVHQLT